VKVESHLAIGLFTWGALILHHPSPIGAVAGAQDPGLVALSFPAVALASLLPDLDHPHAAIGESWILHPLAWTASKTLHHRGILHSSLAVLVVYFGVSYLLGPFLGLAWAFGYAAHIVADFLTVRGVPLFAPLTQQKLHLPLVAIHTGSLFEFFYVCAIVAASAIYAVSAGG
jgi:inner membrane protein